MSPTRSQIFEGGHEEHEGFGHFLFKLRALRDLRGKKSVSRWLRLGRAGNFVVQISVLKRI